MQTDHLEAGRGGNRGEGERKFCFAETDCHRHSASHTGTTMDGTSISEKESNELQIKLFQLPLILFV